jgi:hypothetical protein
MDFPPSREQHRAVLQDKGHRAPNLAAFHTNRPDQFGRAIGAGKIDLCLTVALDMDMRRLVVVGENHDLQPRCAKDRYHCK